MAQEVPHWSGSILSYTAEHKLFHSHSSWELVSSGVPQESVHRPVLFLLYRNNIQENIQSNIWLFSRWQHFQRCFSCVREIVIHLSFALPDLYYKHWMLSVSTWCLWNKRKLLHGWDLIHYLLPSNVDVLTTRPLNLPVVTGWVEHIEQWGLRTIFPKMFFFCVKEIVINFPILLTFLLVCP